ncbi:MAG: AAA family ATPase [Aureispira sp.]
MKKRNLVVVSEIKAHFHQLGYSDEDIIINGRNYYYTMTIRVEGKMICVVHIGNVSTIKKIIQNKSNDLLLDKSIPFIVLANESRQEVYQVTSDGLKRSNWDALHIHHHISNIEQIHQKSFTFLHKKFQEDRSFTFHLRTRNNDNRLEKGYFFLGNEHYCAISFWSGRDWKNKTNSIYLDLHAGGYTRLILTAKDSVEKAIFLQQVADLIGATQVKQKGGNRPVWIKTYSENWERNYTNVLEKFVRQDKEIIDAQIFKAQRRGEENLGDIGFIPLEEFEPNLERALVIQEKLAQQKDEDTAIATAIPDTSPIQLQKLQLQNIAMFESFTMDLDARVICIVGDNGTGKTTLLKAIVLGLIGVDESTEFDPDKAKYRELQELLRMVGLDEHGNRAYAGAGKIAISYQRQKKYHNKVLLEQQANTLDVVLRDDFGQNAVSGLIESNYFSHLVIAFTQGGHASEYQFGSYEQHRGNIGDVSALLFDARQDYFKALEEWIFDLDGDSANDARAQQILDLVFEVVSGVVGFSVRLESVEHQRKEIWVCIGEDKPVLFKLISQGFTKVFAWIGHFIKRLSATNSDQEDFKNAPAILLIDEIDTYLHPKWQRNILAFLAATFTQTQFIVTTHSPLVANYIDGEEIEGGIALYRLEKGAQEPLQFSKTYGRDLTSIFHDWMGVADRPKEVIHLIDRLFKNIDQETSSSLAQANKQIQQLKKWLEPTDEVLVEAETYYNLALENLEE